MCSQGEVEVRQINGHSEEEDKEDEEKEPWPDDHSSSRWDTYSISHWFITSTIIYRFTPILYANQNINIVGYIWTFYLFLCDVSAVTTPAITQTGQRTQGSTLNRPRKALRWKRKAAARRRTEKRRGIRRKRGRKTKQTKMEHYQRKRSQRRRGRCVISNVIQSTYM